MNSDKNCKDIQDINNTLSKKVKVLSQELKDIHDSKLWKMYLFYRKFAIRSGFKPNIPDEETKIKYLEGKFKKNNILGICHPDWQGVKNATINQCSKVITINDFDNQAIDEIIKFIKRNNFSKIAINAIPNNTEKFIHKISQTVPTTRIYLIWHGSFTQQTIEDHISRIDDIYPYFKKIYKFGFVKNNTAEIFQKLGTKAEFIPNRIAFTKKDFCWKQIKNKKISIGILSKFLWHKNNVNQVIAASLLKNSEIHTLFFPKIKYLSRLLDKKIQQHTTLEHSKYKKLLSEMDINLYVSLTECYPMVFFESLTTGTPCLIGKTSEFILEKHKELKDFLVVQNPEDIFEINNKIKKIVTNYNLVQKLCYSFIKTSDKNNSQSILNFFRD